MTRAGTSLARLARVTTLAAGLWWLASCDVVHADVRKDVPRDDDLLGRDVPADLRRDDDLPAGDVRAAVELFVNETPCGDVIILLRDGAPWLPVESLRAAGLRVDRGAPQSFGVEYISLSSLDEAMTYRFDEPELQLHIVARGAVSIARPADARGHAHGYPASTQHQRLPQLRRLCRIEGDQHRHRCRRERARRLVSDGRRA